MQSDSGMACLLKTRTRWPSRLIATAALLAGYAFSASAAPVRLGILVESPALSTAADLLTTELSHEARVAVLEREQIGRVLKEQGLSASHGGDFVKLGHLLGADGLLFLDVAMRGTNQVVTTRLAAVKPGVVLDLAVYPYPLPEAEGWSKVLVQRLGPLFPKLGVLTKDAVPVSFLNIRAAVRSADGEALERQLSQVLLSRLVGEPEVFVLERQKLQTLVEEKDLKGLGNEPFWNGSYLLEGAIDTAGFKTNTITLNLRLTPPGQKTAIDFELAGARKEAASLISALAEKILRRLKGQTGVQDWKARDEAGRYLLEAQWAWRWSLVPEALAAADAAWVLGHQDPECGTIRVRAAMALAIHQTPLEHKQRLERMIFTPSARPPPPRVPNQKDIEMAARALSNFQELLEALPPGEPQIDSPAFDLGLETLTEASELLRIVHRDPGLAHELKDPLIELRSSLREVASWLSSLPSVRAAYWPSADTPLREPFQRQCDLFLCETEYARFWHERPEDCLAFYREMMTSPTFALIHNRIDLANGLSAWAVQDQQRLPTVWSNFVNELCLSTNPLFRAEGKLYAFAAMPGDPSFAIVDTANARRDAELRKQAAEAALAELLATNPVPVAGVSPYRIAPRLASALAEPYSEIRSEYQRRCDALEQELAVQNQKQFLASDTSFHFTNMVRVFQHGTYTPQQAAELQPLVVAYKSNLLALLKEQPLGGQADGVNWGSVMEIESVERRIRQVLGLPLLPPTRMVDLRPLLGRDRTTNRAPLHPARTNLVQLHEPARLAPAAPSTSPPPVQAVKTNGNSATPLAHWPPSTSRQFYLTDDQRAEALVMSARLHKIPVVGLQTGHASGPFRVAVEGHRVLAGKVWFDVRYGWGENWGGAVAVWDPNNQRPVVSAATMTNGWQIIPYPSRDSSWNLAFSRGPDEAVNGVHFELFKGAFYLSVWHQSMQRYHPETGVWEPLPIPISKPTQLFALGECLFAANDEAIFKILDDGRSTRLLASCRRRPTGSALDSLSTLSTPTLFLDSKNSLCASVRDKVYRWDNRDWTEIFSLPGIAPPTVFDDAIIFRTKEPPTASFWYWPKGGTKPEPYWQEIWPGAPYAFGGFPTRPVSSPPANRRGPANPVLANAAVLSEGPNFYFLARHLDRAGNPDGQADLIRLEKGVWKPLLIPIRLPPGFELTPDLALTHRFPWMTSLPGTLLIGQPGQKGVVTLPWKDVEAAFNAEKARQRRAPAL